MQDWDSNHPNSNASKEEDLLKSKQEMVPGGKKQNRGRMHQEENEWTRDHMCVANGCMVAMTCTRTGAGTRNKAQGTIELNNDGVKQSESRPSVVGPLQWIIRVPQLSLLVRQCNKERKKTNLGGVVMVMERWMRVGDEKEVAKKKRERESERDWERVRWDGKRGKVGQSENKTKRNKWADGGK